MESVTRLVYADAEATSEVVQRLDAVNRDVTAVETVAGCFDTVASADCVVLTDTLPDADLVDLCTRLRDQYPAVSLVVYPANGSETLAGKLFAAGAAGYVPQSDGLETLTARVDELLARSTPPTDDAPSSSPVAPDGCPLVAPSHDGPTTEPSNRLELLVDQSPLAIIEWTPDFEVASWNPAATALFGYTPAEAHGEDALDLLVPDSNRAAIRDYWSQLTDGELDESPRWRTNRNLRKDGTELTCEWYNTPIFDSSGDRSSGDDSTDSADDPVRILSFVQDVTAERKRADALEALQETTNELIRAESADDVAEIVMDATEHVIDRSLAALRFYDEESHSLELAAITEDLEENTADINSIGPDDQVLWEAYTDGEPTIIDDVSTELIPYDIDIDVGTAILYPLGDHGMLSVASPDDGELDVAAVHLVHVLAATAEAALDRAARDRELERTKTIVETVGDSVYALDRDGTLETINDRLTEVTGYDREELVGKHISTILTPESVDRCRKRVRALASADENRIATYEITLVTRGGEQVPCEVNTTLLRTDGTLEGSVGIIRDISNRKRMEQELVDRKAKIEALHGVASRLDDCESRAEIYERTVEAAEDVLNFDVCVVDRVEGDSLVKAALSSTLEGEFHHRLSVDQGIAGKTYQTGETHRIDDVRESSVAMPQDDAFRSVLSVPIGDWGVFQTVSTEIGSFTREDEELAELLLSHVTDALDRIAFEEQLRTERDRFAALFENVPDAVVSARQRDGEAIVESVNPAFERVFGYEESTLVDEPLDQFIVPSNQAAEAESITRRGANGEIVEAEVKRRTADGLREFMMRIVPMTVNDRSDRAFGLYTDITAQKQRQKRVEILNRVLRHDMRNGMNIIDGCAEMLAEAVENDDLEYAETIQERAGELVGLAEKTRAVERVLEREHTTTGPVDITEAVTEAVSRLETTHAEVDVDCTTPGCVFTRASGSLQTALYQVLENAVDHNDTDAPSIEVSVCDCGDDGMLSVLIADDGPGIPDEERELLQGEREITQLRHASGLGLWLVNLVVTQSGGQLRFLENEPRGTVVMLELPQADVELTGSASDGTATGD